MTTSKSAVVQRLKHSVFLRAKENHFIIIIFIFGLILRLIFINKLTTFLGDQGIDLLNIYNLFNQKFSLLGPTSSIFGIYNGPLYYWLIAPFFYISGFNVAVPAILTTLLNSFSIVISYLTLLALGLNKRTGLVAAGIFASSPLLIYFSKVIFNSFPSLFFLSIFYYLLAKVISQPEKRIFYLLLGIASGLSSQLHYLNYLTLLIALAAVVSQRKETLLRSFLVIAGLIIGDWPIVVFEFRHQFFNLRTLFIGISQSPDASFSIWNGAKATFFGTINFFKSLLTTFGIVIIAISAIRLIKGKASTNFHLRRPIAIFWLPLAVLAVAISLLGAMGYEIQNHYFFLIIFPLIFLISTVISSYRSNIPGVVLIVVLSVTSLWKDVQLTKAHTGYDMPRGWNLEAVERVAGIIEADIDSHGQARGTLADPAEGGRILDPVLKNTGQKNFNVAWFIDGNTRAYALRFLLIKDGFPPLPVESFSNPDSLYVLYNNGRGSILEENTWEVSIYRPFLVEREWPLFDKFFIIKLKKANPSKDNPETIRPL